MIGLLSAVLLAASGFSASPAVAGASGAATATAKTTATPAPTTLAPEIAAGVEADPILRALRDEMARGRALKMEGSAPPYFVESSVVDMDWFDVWASFGALTYRNSDTTRVITVKTRVGTPELDNTNFGPLRPSFGWPAPGEDDYDALRESLWLAYDRSYKDSLEVLARKQAWMKSNEVPDRPADFGPAKVTSLLLAPAKLQSDSDRWTRLVKQASAVFRDKTFILTGNAFYRGRAGTQRAVNSDSSFQRYGDTWVLFGLDATAQAPDGMFVESHWEARGRVDTDLPKDEVVLKAAHDLASRLEALTKAPLIQDEYTGPVLFTGQASAQFFLSAIGDTLRHPNNSVGARPAANLVDRIGRHVASPLLTVRDDPTQREWKGTPLSGWYAIDDDGVLPQPITLIAGGVLETCYMSRAPAAHVTATNGHSHNGTGGPGNIFVEAKKALDRAALKKRLIELATDQGLDYGLWIEELGPPVSGRGSAEYGPVSEIELPRARVAWRVHLDGREELVRISDFKAASFRLLQDIDALGDDPAATNIETRQQLVSVIAPSVLVSHLDVTKPTREFVKPPLIPRPPVSP